MQVMAIAIALTCIATLAVALRLYTRFLVKNSGFDDYFIVASLVRHVWQLILRNTKANLMQMVNFVFIAFVVVGKLE